MKKILFDCDNTAGIDGRPMDDALALIYLLGNRNKAELLGVTCTFGNGTAAEVYDCTRKLFQEVRTGGLPLFRGAEQGENPCCSESARFIADTANRYPGEITFLGIGSVTNLYGAFLLDPEIFDKLGQIVLMGGITEPLYTHGVPCPELNFSVNHKASAAALSRGKRLSVISGNNCLDVSFLPKAEFMDSMQVCGNPVGAYTAQKCGYRFIDRKAVYGEEGSYCWDAVAAAYALYPELFEDIPTACFISEENLKSGFLAPGAGGGTVLNLPRVRDAALFRQNLYRGWLAVELME